MVDHMKKAKKEKRGKEEQKDQNKPLDLPTVEQLEAELGREKYRWRFRRVMRNTIYALITVAAAAPATPQWNPATNSRSSPMFSTEEIIR